ncbi:MAG: cytochrome c family protein [candidate division Zixibacteria bacterium]|nr:cytochrome c family protein [candidate division Zixibacteria bacterium]
MKKLALFAVMVLALVALVAGYVVAQDKPKPTYVGADKCKTCHKDQHASWLETKHAKAFSVLKPEEQKKPECVKCHITGETAEKVTLEGVQCEACHGPGSEYKKPTIMSKSKFAAGKEAALKAAKDAGLVIPTAEVCVKCHTKEGNANFKEFDFEKRKGLVHKMTAAAPATK